MDGSLLLSHLYGKDDMRHAEMHEPGRNLFLETFGCSNPLFSQPLSGLLYEFVLSSNLLSQDLQPLIALFAPCEFLLDFVVKPNNGIERWSILFLQSLQKCQSGLQFIESCLAETHL